MITISNLCKQYPEVTPLKDVSATINKGDVISVIGPSGSGKSTLIRCLNRLETPTSGTITVDGICITDKRCKLSEVRKKMGMVFQSFNLFEHLTVIENIMMPQIDLLGTDKQTAYDNAIKLLQLVGLENRAMQYPNMLSGGQKQRVAIARTLSTNPDIILFDEPTSALDPTMVGEVQSVIHRLADMGKTMIIVTHEMKFAREVCNRVFFLTNGIIYEDGTPEQIFDHPSKELTRRFIRQLKVFEKEADVNGFDLSEILHGIEQFGINNCIPYKFIGKIQAVTEELTAQILLPKLTESKISVTVEYDDEKQTAYAIFRYGGEPFDPNDSDNELALTLLKMNCSDIEYKNIKNEEYSNEFSLHIK